jgi:hypothetical protein
MRRHLALAALSLLVTLSARAAADVEFSFGGGIGSSFSRHAPFELGGLQFAASPYRQCPLDVPPAGCLAFGLSDVAFDLQRRYDQLGVAGLEARVRVVGPVSLGAGALAGLALGRQRLLISNTGDVVAGRPFVSDDIISVADRYGPYANGGIGTLAYLHAGLRVERGFRTRTNIGSKPSPLRIFLEGGGGWLASVPGGATAGIGRPPAMHIAAGLSVDRGLDRTIVLTLRHVRALHQPDAAVLLESRSNWTMLQLGWRLK